MATQTVATDFPFSHLQRTPGQTPEWHIFGLRPGSGGTEGRRKEEEEQEVEVEEEEEEEEEEARAMWLMLVNSIQPCPGIVAGSAQRRRYQAPGPHTDPGQKVDSHTDICIHTHTHARTHAGRNTQTTNRQIKDSLSVSATQQLLQFPWQQPEQCSRKGYVGECVCLCECVCVCARACACSGALEERARACV